MIPPKTLALRTALLCALAALLLPSTALAQHGIGAGQTASGQLTSSSPLAVDDSHYAEYTYTGAAGDLVRITLRSADFDAYLLWGQGSGDGFSATSMNDDGAGGTDSRLDVIVGEGTWTIRINTLGERETGAYTLDLERIEPGAAAASAPSRIDVGQTVTGSLAGSDPVEGDGSHYDEYVYAGSAGDRIRITLRSDDFDTYLYWGEGTGEAYSAADSDDDGAGGTDSRLDVTVGAGVRTIRVNSLLEGETGDYTLSVERIASDGATSAAEAIRAGQTVTGRLEPSDQTAGDDTHFDVYTYRGQPGERLVITLRSDDFDAFLIWGSGIDDDFTAEETDDDSAGGTDARLQVTAGEGDWTIVVNSLGAGETGAYTLSVERQP